MPKLGIKSRSISSLIAFSLLISSTLSPKRAEAELIVIIQTGLAIYSATSAGLTPIIATAKMLSSKRTEGVSFVSYINDAASNVASGAQVAGFFGDPNYYALAANVVPFLGDLSAALTYHLVKKPIIGQDIVIYLEQTDTKGKFTGVIRTGNTEYYFNNCVMTIEDKRFQPGRTKKAVQCIGNLCKRLPLPKFLFRNLSDQKQSLTPENIDSNYHSIDIQDAEIDPNPHRINIPSEEGQTVQLLEQSFQQISATLQNIITTLRPADPSLPNCLSSSDSSNSSSSQPNEKKPTVHIYNDEDNIKVILMKDKAVLNLPEGEFTFSHASISNLTKNKE